MRRSDPNLSSQYLPIVWHRNIAFQSFSFFYESCILVEPKRVVHLNRKNCKKRKYASIWWYLPDCLLHLTEQLCPWKLLIRTTLPPSFIIWKWIIRLFAFFSHLPPPNGGERVKLWAHFGVIGKLIPDFLIPVHWSYLNIWIGFITNRPNVAEKRDIRRRVTSALIK